MAWSLDDLELATSKLGRKYSGQHGGGDSPSLALATVSTRWRMRRPLCPHWSLLPREHGPLHGPVGKPTRRGFVRAPSRVNKVTACWRWACLCFPLLPSGTTGRPRAPVQDRGALWARPGCRVREPSVCSAAGRSPRLPDGDLRWEVGSPTVPSVSCPGSLSKVNPLLCTWARHSVPVLSLS